MEFTVKRSEWLRGEGADKSYLLREDGKKCCVGFFCLAAGSTPDTIRLEKEFTREVSHVIAGREAFLYAGVGFRTPWAEKVYTTNDDTILSDPERESKLTELFAQKGHIIKFVD